MRHYITDQHPDHLGEVWLCNLATGEALRHLPGIAITTFALTASGEHRPVGITSDVARVLIAAGDFAEVLTADAATLTPWEGIIAFVNSPTDDRRQLDGGGGSFRTFPIPHMAQMATGWGHDGAMIVGRMDSGTLTDTEVTGTGVFDSGTFGVDAARLVDQQMLDRVSIDLGAMDVETEVIDTDEDGWPIDWLDHFTSWQIAGLTQVNVSAFADARIHLTAAMPEMPAEPVVAAPSVHLTPLAIPTAAPGAWFAVPEPEPGQPFALGSDGSEWLIEQPDSGGAVAMPLQIMDDGRVMGHIAFWGQCHVGHPGCVSPPTSSNSYSRFHVGYHVTDAGDTIATGVLTAGCDHAITHLRAPEALSHYAHNGVGWADVRITDGIYGPWACGVLRPDVTAEQIRVLRAGALSGDWRPIDGRLEMIATLAVNTPGFPIAREAVAASAEASLLADATLAYRMEDGELLALVAANPVQRCSECAKRAAARSGDVELARRVERLERALMPQLRANAEAAIVAI